MEYAVWGLSVCVVKKNFTDKSFAVIMYYFLGYTKLSYEFLQLIYCFGDFGILARIYLCKSRESIDKKDPPRQNLFPLKIGL